MANFFFGLFHDKFQRLNVWSVEFPIGDIQRQITKNGHLFLFIYPTGE